MSSNPFIYMDYLDGDNKISRLGLCMAIWLQPKVREHGLGLWLWLYDDPIFDSVCENGLGLW